uniref:Olfactory receptor 72 n=1 Tax=Aulacocentrum confusum TaxID=2767324 RepID=A0A7G8Z991_9HYME|nr:olfactory receptor 72 [Aulacocentrum confusum]
MFSEDVSFKFFMNLGGFLAIALVFLVPKEDGALPIRAAYPFDTTASPLHELAFIIQAYSVSYGLFTIVLMDDLVVALIKWINFQLLILESNYEKCHCDTIRKASFNVSNDTLKTIKSFNIFGITEDQMNINSFIPFEELEVHHVNDSFIWRFKTCAKHHQRLLNIVDQMNAIFSSSMLMQLFASFSMICLTGFQAVLGAGEKKNLLKFIVYLGAALSQLCNWCWFGNEMLYQSASLTRGQWLSGWERENHADVKPLMIISQIKARKPLQLKAGKFFNMSMQTFIAVLRNSYSFFALLTSVTSD